MSHLVFSAQIINGMVGAAGGSAVGAVVGGRIARKSAEASNEVQRELASEAAASQYELLERGAQLQADQARLARGHTAAVDVLAILAEIQANVDGIRKLSVSRPTYGPPGDPYDYPRELIHQLHSAMLVSAPLVTRLELQRVIADHYLVVHAWARDETLDEMYARTAVLRHLVYLQRACMAYLDNVEGAAYVKPPLLNDQSQDNQWHAPDVDEDAGD